MNLFFRCFFNLDSDDEWNAIWGWLPLCCHRKIYFIFEYDYKDLQWLEAYLTDIPHFYCTALSRYWPIYFCYYIAVLYVRNGFSKYPRHDCLFDSLLKRTTKETPNPASQPPCEGNPPMTHGFPSKRAKTRKKNVSMSWCLHKKASLAIMGNQ